MNGNVLPAFDWSRVRNNSIRVLLLYDSKETNFDQLESIRAQIVLSQSKKIAPTRYYTNVSHNTQPRLKDLLHLEKFQQDCMKKRSTDSSLAIFSMSGLDCKTVWNNPGLKELLNNGRFYRISTILQTDTLPSELETSLTDFFDFILVKSCTFEVANRLYLRFSTPKDSPTGFSSLYKHVSSTKCSSSDDSSKRFFCLLFTTQKLTEWNMEPHVLCAEITNLAENTPLFGFIGPFFENPTIHLHSVSETLAWLDINDLESDENSKEANNCHIF